MTYPQLLGAAPDSRGLIMVGIGIQCRDIAAVRGVSWDRAIICVGGVKVWREREGQVVICLVFKSGSGVAAAFG